VIIGAGAVGAASALEALRAGFRTTLLEPGEPGGEQAASYGNAAWLSSHSVIPPAGPGVWKKVPFYLADPLGPLAIRPAYLPKAAPWLLRYVLSARTEELVAATARALRPLLADAPALHEKLAAEAGVPDLIERRGLLHIYPTRADFEAEAASWRARRSVGIDWTELNGDELRRREPDLNPRYGFGVFVGEAGHCRDPGSYVAAMVAAAQMRGADLRPGRARGFEIRDGKLIGIILEGGAVLPCDAAVVCAGAHSKPLAAAAGDRVPLETERGYHVMMDEFAIGPRTPMMLHDYKIVVTMTKRGVRIAGQVEIAGLEAPPNWRRSEILRRSLLDAFPTLPRDLPESRVRNWMGHRPSTPDGLPCIGRSHETPDIVYAFGHGHVGLVSSARTGRVVAQLLGGREPEIPLAPFDPRRFGWLTSATGSAARAQ
jgi:D-amino-acid dehydrogenase